MNNHNIYLIEFGGNALDITPGKREDIIVIYTQVIRNIFTGHVENKKCV